MAGTGGKTVHWLYNRIPIILDTTLNPKFPRTNRISGFRLAMSVLVFLLPVLLTSTGAVRAAGAAPVPDSLLRNMGFIVFDDRERAPEITGPSISGGRLDLEALRGRWVLLNFWATWCVPCRKEIPTLVLLAHHMDGQRVVLVSVAMDHDTSRIRHYLQKIPVDYPVMLGREGTVDARYIGMGLPETYLIDPEGYLVGKAAGSRDWSGSASYRLFDALSTFRTPGTVSPQKDPS